MKFTVTTCLAALAAMASAYTPANTAQPPSGNPIGHPELGELVPAGQTFTITWAPDAGDRVSIILLRGPSTNVVPILTIVENIPNTGSYIWSPVPSSLEPDTTGYGIQLIVEGTGQYQYSPQFGVKNDAYTGSSSSSTGSATESTTGSATGSATGSTTVTLVSATTSDATGYASALATGTGNYSVPIVSPTKSMTVPSSFLSTYSPTATTSSSEATTSAEEVPSATSSGAAATGAVFNVMAVVAAGVVGVLAA